LNRTDDAPAEEGWENEANFVHREWGISPDHDFFAVHTILAAATGVFSLIGAYFLLTGSRQHNPN
jgi:hypothetical protein